MLGVLKPCTGGDPIPLTRPKLLVGRQAFCDVVLPYSSVSSRHCELEFKEGYWFVRDLGSTNGTRIDGKSCADSCIRPGSVLAIARHRFELEYEAQGIPPDAPATQDVISDRLLKKVGLDTDESDVAAAGGSEAPRRRPTHRGHLLPVGGGTPIVLSSDHLVVGRDRSCDIRLSLATVSSRHCELEFSEGYWLVRDLGSHNGIKVDGEKVVQKWLLPQSVLQITSFRFKVLYVPTPGAAMPKDAGVSFTRSLLERAGLKRRR